MNGRAWCVGLVASLIVWLVLPAWSAEGGGEGWVDLFNGKDLTGWKLVNPKGKNGWRVEKGIVINQTPSTNIVTDRQYKDFELHCEFAIPSRSNAGIYILNRYEVQIFDDYQRPIHSHMCGSMYGEITPTANACKPPAKDFPKIADNEWQTFDIKFQAARYNEAGEKTAGVRVSVVHNGVTIIDNAELKTPTGAARRFDEEAPGPILLQGDHGPVAFRSLRIRGQAYPAPDPKAPGPDVIGLEAQSKEMPDNKAMGLALTWRTPFHAFAPAYRVYRGESADVPLDRKHLVATAVKRSAQDCSFAADGTYYYRIVAVGASGKAGKPSEAIGAPGKANQVATSDLGAASWASLDGENVPVRGRAANRKPMVMHGRRFERGIGVQGTTTIVMNVDRMVGSNKDYRLRATVGMDDSVPLKNREIAAARFIVEIDGKKAFDSGKMKWSDGTTEMDIAVPAGARQIALIVRREGERGSDNSDWGDVRLEEASR